MKVLISADMEGTAGVADRAHTAIPDRAALTGVQHNAAEYDWARRLMTAEVNAAVAGSLDGGATEVWVTDAHGSMRNLLPLELHRDARYVSGTPKPLCMLEGLDQDVRLKGVSMGEYGINAALAGHEGPDMLAVFRVWRAMLNVMMTRSAV